MGVRLLFLFVFWVCSLALAGRATNTPVVEALRTAKVVRQYALTSANDFPLRDPTDWRLLASNDDGKTWVTLDRRTAELFSGRHQRRVFSLTNRAAFNIYRLQIDRVRDPTAANAVQLAEIEAMGETEQDLGPTPMFADTVSAQGENAPFELSRNLFDGQLDTKWLDYATQFADTRSSWIQWQYTAPSNVQVKSVRELISLRSQVGHAYGVEIAGRVVGALPGTNRLCFMDATGHLELFVPGGVKDVLPCQQVLLTGKSAMMEGHPNVAQAKLAKIGVTVPDQPKRVALGELLSPGMQWQWVEVEGQLAFHSQASDQVSFELEDGAHRIWVHLLSPDGLDFQKMGATRIRVGGLCEGVLNDRGKMVAGILWVAGAGDLKPVLPTNTTAEVASVAPRMALSTPAEPLTAIAQIRRLGRDELVTGIKVRLRGVVIETLGSFIQQGDEGLELWQDDGKPELARIFGDYIEVVGRVFWEDRSGPKVRAEQVKVLGKGELPQPVRLNWSQMTSGKPIDRWVEIEGVVRSTDGSHLLLACEGGQVMATVRFAAAPEVEKLVGATVRIRGVGVIATDDRGQVQGVQLIAPSLDYVEVRMPAVDAFTLAARPIGTLLLIKPPYDLAHRVNVEGTITFHQGAKFFLQDASGSAMVLARQEVILSEPLDRTMHWLFLRTTSTNQAAAGDLNLQIGDQVQVAGFPEFGGESPVLTEALFRKEGKHKLVKPVDTSVENILTGRPDASLVSLECLVLGREVLGADSVLQLRAGQKVFQGVLAGDRRAFSNLMPGSQVRITGVCQVEPNPYAGLGRNVTAFKILLRTADDLVVLARPPWWNFKHTLIVVGALIFVLVLASVWIRTLHGQVEERTKRLKQEIEEHMNTERQLAEETRRVQAEIEEHRRTEARLGEKTGLLEQEIEERKRVQAEVDRVHRELVMASRLAGMAEVATGVLHNVGNVLNGVNVLASLIVTHVQKSKVSSVSKLASLFGEHRHDLGTFMTENANGQQISGYVERLAGHLADEQSSLLEKVKTITDNVQHIKEIVAMQQSYARIGGVLEQISLQDIVEDSLRMHHEAMARHGIKIVREFEGVPRVTVDRNKVLQILFNLLANAKYACEAGIQSPKQVTVRICQSNGCVHVSVADNGFGIAPENLPKIFTQGFTTRRGGHGFGLHSSILAAQELGGSLHVQSSGLGLGAVFTLKIPVAANPALILSELDGANGNELPDRNN